MRVISLAMFLVFACPAIASEYKVYLEQIDTALAAMPDQGGTVEGAIAEQQKLLHEGERALRDFADEFPEFSEIASFVADQSGAMLDLTLDQIEQEWHLGGAYVTAGHPNLTEDHFGVLNSLADMVVHPATAIIALRVYSSKPDARLLDQVRDEMSEVQEHIGHL